MSIIDLIVLDAERALQLRIDAARAQAALLEALNGQFLQTWPGEYEVRETIKDSIVEMGKIVRGRA